MTKNIKINGKEIGKIFTENNSIRLVYNDKELELVDSRLSNDLEKYDNLMKTINDEITNSDTSKKDKIKYILILISLFNAGLITLAVLNKLITLLFISTTVLVILGSIISQISKEIDYRRDNIDLMYNYLYELEDIEEKLDENIINRFENEEDYNHYMIYTEQRIDDLTSKCLVR